MDTALFDYDFDPAQVAQRPAAERTGSRLLLLDRASGAVSHHHFSDLPELVRGDELLVVNQTRVLPARLLTRKPTGGQVELLLPGEVGLAHGPFHLRRV